MYFINIHCNQRMATTGIALTMPTLFLELRFGQDGVDHFEWGAGGGGGLTGALDVFGWVLGVGILIPWSRKARVVSKDGQEG